MKSRGLSRIVVVAVSVFMASLASAEDCLVTPSGNGIYENDELLVVLSKDMKFIFEPRGEGFIDHDGALGHQGGLAPKDPRSTRADPSRSVVAHEQRAARMAPDWGLNGCAIARSE